MLREIAPRFLTQYPDVEFDIVCDGRFVDIVEAGFDAGVRLAEAIPQDMLVVRMGGDIRFLAVASPAYLDRCDHRRRLTGSLPTSLHPPAPAEWETLSLGIHPPWRGNGNRRARRPDSGRQ
nr:LysR substrate-binding domain-containing protein [Pseudochelatococcus contaminans]